MGADHLNATLLHYAASGGNLEIMQKLLDLGCDKDALTKYGRSVLHYSAYGKILCAGEYLCFSMMDGECLGHPAADKFCHLPQEGWRVCSI